jgi:hypothetical protein
MSIDIIGKYFGGLGRAFNSRAHELCFAPHQRLRLRVPCVGIDTSYLYIEYVFGLRSFGLVKGKITVKPNTKLLPMVCGF